MTHFYALLYLDRLMAQPVEIWQVGQLAPPKASIHTDTVILLDSEQVFAHCLRKVDMRAVIGQTSQTSVVVRGAHTTRRVACYTSHPDELQVVTLAPFCLFSGRIAFLSL